MGEFYMSEKEIDRAAIVSMVIEQRLTQREAALRLGLSIRQIRRLCVAYRKVILPRYSGHPTKLV